MADRIFISYRRSGSLKDANMIFDHLVKVFGSERVFMDVDGIDPGDDLVEVIERQLDSCTVLVALIGQDWLHATDERGQRKLDDDEDFVRVEIRTALERKMRVIPLLLDGAAMPRKPDLPPDLHPLTRMQGLPVDATKLHDFRSAMGRLVQALNNSPQPVARPSVPAIVKPHFSWMSDQGEDQYGQWAEFTVRGVVQRLRWIEPGEFWMGSTETERKRFGITAEDEFPRHRVSLTQGFWLADTACTQGLWQTVVGDNPSRFSGDLDLPVEQVSWDDVTQKFLPALSRQLGGVGLHLPTEAQWEYACRAGTETAYAFGDLITPEQVNYEGNYPPPGGKEGPYRGKTVRVKALPANVWGLHQMHGNVLEWCADAPRVYTAESLADPDDGQDGSHRALRGGSWFDPADGARSAFRTGGLPFYAPPTRGFRLSLRSPGP